ncbi:MAG: ABC-F family ATP-binding cassette domain-containing protein [Oscillospiraceae bacterium]|nr:ABC-F family ATP-binding cassette domain-containing protein [Oscillospiraceae bacterium]
MTDISISELTKAFDQEKNILDHLSFQIYAGERVGLLGQNGAGKTTLFRILTGELDYDAGRVELAHGRRLGLVSQIPVYPPEYTVEDVLRSAFERVEVMQREMEELTRKMEQDASPQLLKRYGAVSDAFERSGGYQLETQLNKVAAGLSISQNMRTQLFSSLSGGEKTRVNLGRLILEDTDILLLDEPTNHLDLHSTEWLEDYLLHFQGTVLAISHDRYFLDKVVSRVIELKDGRAEFYSGNYSFYVQEKKARFAEQQKRYEKEQAKIAQLSVSAERLHGWGIQNQRLQKRAFAMERRIERLRQTERPQTRRVMKARFGEKEFHGDEVLTARNLKKSFGGRLLFENVGLEVAKGERIAILGDNGTGKTTLLRILLGECAPDQGQVTMGPTVKWGYLPQVVSFSHPERTLVDTMIYEENCTHQSARDRLGAFWFQGEDVFKTVSALSGGEKSRLRLCMLMDDNINLLILDEPTNHLDLSSREWMEEAVEEYDGALIFVSHDRYFIRRFADRIWELGDGSIRDFKGGFDRYRAALEQEERKEQVRRETVRKKAPKKKKEGSLEKRLAALEREIAGAEQKKRELEADMEAKASDYERLNDLYEEQENLVRKLGELYHQWEILASAKEESS